MHQTSCTPLAHTPKGFNGRNFYRNCLYIRTLLHQKICKPTSIYRKFLQQGVFTFLHQNTFTPEGFCTGKLSHRKPFTPNSVTVFTTDSFTPETFDTLTVSTHPWHTLAEKLSIVLFLQFSSHAIFAPCIPTILFICIYLRIAHLQS